MRKLCVWSIVIPPSAGIGLRHAIAAGAVLALIWAASFILYMIGGGSPQLPLFSLVQRQRMKPQRNFC